jgi:hypothetical protein
MEEFQYLSDVLNPDVEQAAGPEAAHADMHYSNLFDVNTSQTGDNYDLATGKPYDNSTFKDEAFYESTDFGYVTTFGNDEPASFDLDDVNDPAAKWLREHDTPRTANNSVVSPSPILLSYFCTLLRNMK